MESPERCPLCEGPAEPYQAVHGRAYRLCGSCDLVFMEPAFRPSPEAERDRYLQHRNSPEHAGYRRFLSAATEPLAKLLPPEAFGLDYGCGTEPAIAAMLGERGFSVCNFDPFFFPHPKALEKRYDFITCTEVVEHFHHPAVEFARLRGMLESGGLLAVLTQLRDPYSDFKEWWYVRDQTHTCFYSTRTFELIGTRFFSGVAYSAGNVWIFRA